ncbi:DEAD-box type RNA helicase, variant 2 [Entomophthora muscae]|uniref:DEAD-box type RNA helicase, variant 2 n=1 Tax=Entomophthora muscae TaxID=34485 RepID=A0ACC2SR53_9FUNG|nr:DEAD-box type RNA helicase, variant 2 [Entomophthora muscae]
MDKFNAKIDQLRAELKKHQCVREELREAANPQDTQRYLASKRQVEEIGDEIDLQFQLRSASSRAMDTARYKVRDDLLNGAEIICCTLSGAGHDMMQNMACEFDTVIIDEAAQSVELASLIPLRFGCRRCIMIGDPHQLPPTVMSLAATKYGYNNSLFARMFNQSNGTAHLLNVQYRMHPAISQLPSTLFYKGRLLDAPGLAESKAAPWHASPLFPPYHFYDVSEGGDTSNRFHSRENTAECEAACAIVRRLCYEFPEVDFKGRIAVISPYKGQISQMKLAFARKFGSGISKTVEFNTIDGFQGQEKDIVIFSCVRAGAAADIGFLSDARRMNVGLTRAQKSLFIIGRAFTLSGDPHWKILVQRAKEQDQYSQINMRRLAVQGRISYSNLLLSPPPEPAKGNPTAETAEHNPYRHQGQDHQLRSRPTPSSKELGLFIFGQAKLTQRGGRRSQRQSFPQEGTAVAQT